MKRLMAITALILVTGVLVSGEKITFIGSTLWSQFTDMAVDSNYAYCTFSAGLMILDISNPTDIKPVAQMPLPGITKGIAVNKNYAYLTNSENELIVIDISNRMQPGILSKFKLPGNSKAITIKDNYVYVGSDKIGISIIDIASLANPTKVGFIVAVGKINGIFISGNYLLFADDSVGAYLYKIDDKTNPVYCKRIGDLNDRTSLNTYSEIVRLLLEIKYGEEKNYLSRKMNNQSIDILDDTESIDLIPDEIIVGHYRYVNGIGVFDITDPGDNIFLGNIPTDDSAYNHIEGTIYEGYTFLKIYSNRLFLVNIKVGFQIADISSPSKPGLIGEYLFNDDPVSAAINGENIFASDSKGYLNIINRTNPNRLFNQIKYELPGICNAISVKDNYAFLACEGFGLCVFDVSSGISPNLVFADTFMGFASDLAISGDYCYLVDLNCFRIFDISKPTKPKLIESDISHVGNDFIVLDSNYLYGIDFFHVINVYEISKAKKLNFIRSLNIAINSNGVFAKYGLFYICDDKNLKIRVIDWQANTEDSINCEYVGIPKIVFDKYLLMSDNKGISCYEIMGPKQFKLLTYEKYTECAGPISFYNTDLCVAHWTSVILAKFDTTKVGK